MANEQYAFIDKAKVPSRKTWQAAIDECGFDLQLNPRMKPLKDSAYSPCTLLGTASGVEIYYRGDRKFLKQSSSINGGRDFCISFRRGHDSGACACACAMIASYALAKHFGAIVSYEGDEPIGLEDLRKATLEIVDMVRKGE
jgi:hypothetical protein